MIAAGERLLTLGQAAGLLPEPPHVATVRRWARRGVRGVCLETVRLGGRLYTSAEAMDRFGRASEGGVAAPRPRPTAGNRRTAGDVWGAW